MTRQKIPQVLTLESIKDRMESGAKKQERTDVSLQAWLFLLEEGGQWTGAAIAKAIGRRDIAGYLNPMVRRGLVKRSQYAPYKYRVDLDCRMARRLTLRDLVKHGVMELAKESES